MKVIQSPGTSNPVGAPTITSTRDAPPEEFERFEDLTRKLVNVPKKEIDKQRKGAS